MGVTNKFVSNLYYKNPTKSNGRWQNHMPSETAASVLKIRELLSHQFKSEFVQDPLCMNTNGWLFHLLARLFSKQLINYTDRKIPGLIGSILCRTKFIDQQILQYINEIENVVILGAGYDSRAYRPLNCDHQTNRRSQFKIYELDLATTQREKKKAVQTIPPLVNVEYISMDFEKDDISDFLTTIHPQAGKRNMFIMEGLIYYLRMDCLKDLVCKLSSQNSYLVFDYFLENFISNRNHSDYGAIEYAQNVRERIYENQLTGLSDNPKDWLEEYGYEMLYNMHPSEANELYLKNTDLRCLNFVRHVVARANCFTSQT